MSNKVEQVPITVAGNILSELSEKIPNNIIALNELIKNAYDACSPSVDITLDSESRLLTIRDYGIGMDTEGIKKLFHISSSDKHYGEIISYKDTKRLTQGSKGLGFLSVFRFGKKVYWKTAQNTQISEFTVDFDSLVTEYNITDKRLDVTLSSSGDFIGTLIQIEINDYNVNTLKRYLSEEVNRNKILNSFIDDKISDGKISADKNFIIKLNIDGEINSTDYEIQLQTQNKPQQLFEINYSSSDQNLVFRKDGKDIFSEEFSFNSDRYSLDINLAAYYLVSKGKSKINSLFYNPTNNNLTPLIYINNNLFNNYMLFDTELMATKKYSEVLKQLIGYISIKSSDSSIQFNSDRTQFSQSELTDEIAHFIEKLNEEIQRIGASLKNELRDFSSKTFIQNRIPEEETSSPDNLKKYIKPNFKLKDSIIFKKQGNKLKCTLFDEETLLDIIPKAKKTIDLGTVESWIDIDDLNKKIANLNELIQVATDISFNGEKVNGFNKLQEGEWLIKNETNTTITSLKIILKKPVQPKIEVHKIDLLRDVDYKLETIFTLYNSLGIPWKRIEPNITTNGNHTIRYDGRKGEIRFGRNGEQTITVSVKDKDTKLEYESDFTFRIKSSEEYEIKPEQLKQSLIRLPITETPNFSSDIKVLINEINELFKTDYSIIPVISYRTLIELTVNDILNNIGEEKKTDLSKNYNKVISIAEDRIKNSRLDDKDKQILLGIYKSIQSQSEVNAFIAFLNLSVHNGARIITKEDVKTKTQEIQLLLVLLHLTTL
ncbi:ATP-binding protein [Streptococcus sanguinis]|uniref:Uncharacterized protein n=1 Tax=Streptococcus sanguinis TaxID=1305 RepID=A0A0B7GME8_STRSA|nr:ATP-binding protein [Streptococcus sanguinis]CEL91017.1 conserved protein of unknown function [Streptococcus sanguinis]